MQSQTNVPAKASAMSQSTAVTIRIPVRVVVVPQRKTGTLTNMGSVPFHIEREGGKTVRIPHGYQMRSDFQGHALLAETKVETYLDGKMTTVKYQFTSVHKDGNVESGFFQTAPLALAELAKLLEERGRPFNNFKNKNNAKIHVGVAYPTMQLVLKELHKWHEEEEQPRETQESANGVQDEDVQSDAKRHAKEDFRDAAAAIHIVSDPDLSDAAFLQDEFILLPLTISDEEEDGVGQ